MIRVTYQKKNGDIIQRIRNTYCPYKIGARTSMGWIVKNIEYKWKHKYYSLTEYDRIIGRACNFHKKVNILKHNLYRFYKESVYFVVLTMFIRMFELLCK